MAAIPKGVTITLLFAISISLSEGIKCYVCTPVTADKSESPSAISTLKANQYGAFIRRQFNGNSAITKCDEALTAQYQATCPEDLPACLKVTLDKIWEARTCGVPINKERVEMTMVDCKPVKETTGHKIIWKNCTCEGDLCNAATSANVALQLMVAILLALLFIN